MKKIDYPKLPKTFKTKWVKALRSGKYKKGTGFLYLPWTFGNGKIDDRYCALGVAGIVCGVPKNKMNLHINLNEYMGKKYNIPKEIINDDFQHIIATKSDDRYSFNKLANWIEKNL